MSPTVSPSNAVPARNVANIYTFQALVNASLWMPIWVVFLNQDAGLTLSEVFLIAGMGWLIQAIGEVPSGAISDAYGRRATLVAGGLVLALGLFLLTVLTGFAGLAVAYVFWAIGNALISGSDTALLYDSAVSLGRASGFSAMASRSFQILLAAQAVGSVAGGLLGMIDLRLPILATVVLTLAAVVVMLRVAEPPRHDAETLTWSQTLSAAIADVRRRPRLLALIVYGALLSGTAFFVPFVLLQPRMEEQGVPIGWLGVLFTVLRLAALLGTRYGPRLISAASLRTWLWGIPALMVVGLLWVADSQVWWVTLAAMLFVAAVNAAIRPEITALLNRQVSSAVRATVLSLQSLVMTVFIALLHPVVGAVSDSPGGIPGAFALLALLSAIPALLAIPLQPVTTGRPAIPPGPAGD